MNEIRPITSVILNESHPLNSEMELGPDILSMGDMDLEEFKDFGKYVLKTKIVDVSKTKFYHESFDQDTFRNEIRERIKQLNEAVQFHKRLYADSKNGSLNTCIHSLEVRDLQLPWSKSPIRIALMTDEEVQSLSVPQIESFSSSQMRMFFRRMGEKPISQIVEKENLLKMHPNLLALLPDSALPTLDLEGFTKKQLSGLSRLKFSSKHRTSLFSTTDWLDEKLKRKLQRKELELKLEKNPPKNKEQFKALFKFKRFSGEDLIQFLRVDEILAYWNFFEEKHTECITPQQFLELRPYLKELYKDHTDENKDRWSGLDYSNMKECQAYFISLDIKDIYSCFPVLPERSLIKIIEKHIPQWNFDKYPLESSYFKRLNLIFIIKYLSLTQIHSLWEKLNGHYTQFFTLKQIERLKPILHILCQDTSDKNRERIQGLIKKWDFKLMPLTSGEFNELFEDKNAEFFFPILTTAQILDLWKSFSDQQLKYITYNQLIGLRSHFKELFQDHSKENINRIEVIVQRFLKIRAEQPEVKELEKECISILMQTGYY